MNVTAGPQPAGACKGNTQFRFGSGLYDITGVVANTGGMGWENLFQVFSGLQQRQYARAFAIESPCNGQRVLMVSNDIGLMWPGVRFGVLKAIAADAELSKFYRAENVMLSATHTHQGPAGYSHDDGGNLFHYGFDQLVYDTIVNGMVAAIKLAHANIQAHPETSAITLADGELLNTNINRSKVAFDLNSEAERREFLNTRGEPIDNPKRVVQLNLVRSNGSAVGVFNWFGVHATVMGEDSKLVSSDIKGYASLGLEKIMHARYDAPSDGADSFVAAFAQADEGDASPNLYIKERPYPDPTRGGGKDETESNAIAGTKQLAKALALYGNGKPLSGPVDVRFFNVPITAITRPLPTPMSNEGRAPNTTWLNTSQPWASVPNQWSADGDSRSWYEPSSARIEQVREPSPPDSAITAAGATTSNVTSARRRTAWRRRLRWRARRRRRSARRSCASRARRRRRPTRSR